MNSKLVEELVIDQVRLRFPSPDHLDDLEVLNKVSLSVESGEFISIIGPSGCGKTTLLNIIAGFQPIQAGAVRYKGIPVSQPSPERAVVFQSAVLFPWLNVYDNVAYGLRRAGIGKKEVGRIVRKHLERVEMTGFESYYPDQLSGGMQQRVALARVLALKPQMLLLDEPFAALDAQTRVIMQELLQDIRKEYQITSLLVTHDVEEAIYLADRVYVMSKRPAQIVKEVKVPFKRTRNLNIRGEAAFTELKSELLRLIIKPV